MFFCHVVISLYARSISDVLSMITDPSLMIIIIITIIIMERELTFLIEETYTKRVICIP